MDDYLEKEFVWVVVDADDAAARTLSDAGARVRVENYFLSSLSSSSLLLSSALLLLFLLLRWSFWRLYLCGMHHLALCRLEGP